VSSEVRITTQGQSCGAQGTFVPRGGQCVLLPTKTSRMCIQFSGISPSALSACPQAQVFSTNLVNRFLFCSFLHSSPFYNLSGSLRSCFTDTTLHDKTLPVIVEGANHNNPTSHVRECISCAAANPSFTAMPLEALSLLSSSMLRNRRSRSLRCLLADTSGVSRSQSLSFLARFSFLSHSLFSLAP